HALRAALGAKLRAVRLPVQGICMSCSGHDLEVVLGTGKHVRTLLRVDIWTFFSGRERMAANGINQRAQVLLPGETWRLSSGHELTTATGILEPAGVLPGGET
ncbi:unnamed protein product, partial [Laminaria digitata]